MGFFSFKCAKTNKSIPAYPYARLPKHLSNVVMVLPDDTTFSGVYDGYGNICNEHGEGQREVYDMIAKYMYGEENRDLIFNNKKNFFTEHGQELFTITKFDWAEPTKKEEFSNYLSEKDIEKYVGMSMNEMNEKYNFEVQTDFEKAGELIKIVRSDVYMDELFQVLSPSESCENQGYFYDDDIVEHLKQVEL
jgi:hypothetical protein